MDNNLGWLDRVLRIVIGGVLVAAATTGNIGIWGWIGVIPLLTGILGFCGAYKLFGLSTCPTKK
jgi:hypothetical protein